MVNFPARVRKKYAYIGLQEMELFEIVVVDTVCIVFFKKVDCWDVKGVEHDVFYALKLSISFRLLASAWQSSSFVGACLGTVGMSHSIGGSGTAAGLGGELNRAPAKRSTDWSLAESLAEFSRARNGEFFGVPQREENLRARGVDVADREPKMACPRASESHSEPELIGDEREGELRPLLPFCIPENCIFNFDESE